MRAGTAPPNSPYATLNVTLLNAFPPGYSVDVGSVVTTTGRPAVVTKLGSVAPTACPLLPSSPVGGCEQLLTLLLDSSLPTPSCNFSGTVTLTLAWAALGGPDRGATSFVISLRTPVGGWPCLPPPPSPAPVNLTAVPTGSQYTLVGPTPVTLSAVVRGQGAIQASQIVGVVAAVVRHPPGHQIRDGGGGGRVGHTHVCCVGLGRCVGGALDP